MLLTSLWNVALLTQRWSSDWPIYQQIYMNADNTVRNRQKSHSFLLLCSNVTFSLKIKTIRLIRSKSLSRLFIVGTENISTSCITSWKGHCSTADRRTLQPAVRIAETHRGPRSPPLALFSRRDKRRKSSVLWKSPLTPPMCCPRYRTSKRHPHECEDPMFPAKKKKKPIS